MDRTERMRMTRSVASFDLLFEVELDSFPRENDYEEIPMISLEDGYYELDQIQGEKEEEL